MGRLLNVFSKDVDSIDQQLPMSVDVWCKCFMAVLGGWVGCWWGCWKVEGGGCRVAIVRLVVSVGWRVVLEAKLQACSNVDLQTQITLLSLTVIF